MQTKLFRQQHGEILRHLDQVGRMLNTATEQEMCLELSRLAGIVKMHLALEDKNLYPRMLAHQDAQIRATAEKYQQTMADLAPAYIAFHEKWMRSGAIEGERAQFVKDFTQVSNALKQRIQFENEGLYNLIDDNDIRLAS